MNKQEFRDFLIFARHSYRGPGNNGNVPHFLDVATLTLVEKLQKEFDSYSMCDIVKRLRARECGIVLSRDGNTETVSDCRALHEYCAKTLDGGSGGRGLPSGALKSVADAARRKKDVSVAMFFEMAEAFNIDVGVLERGAPFTGTNRSFSNSGNFMFLETKGYKITFLSGALYWETELAGKKVRISAGDERLLAYFIYAGYKTTYMSYILKQYDNGISEDDIKKFVYSFRLSHECEKPKYVIKDIPLYSSIHANLLIPNPFSYSAKITEGEERELVGILRNRDANRKKLVEDWFYKYVNSHNLQPKDEKDGKGHWKDLAACFCYMHGVSILSDRIDKKHYISIFEAGVEVDLLSKNNVWECEIAGKAYRLGEPEERLLAYLVFGEGETEEIGDTLERISGCFVSEEDVGEFVLWFKSMHITRQKEFGVDCLHFIEPINKTFRVPNMFSYNVVIDGQQEDQLIKIVRNRYLDRVREIENWFLLNYVNRYTSPSEDACKYGSQYQAHELARQFLRQHGVNIYNNAHLDNRSRKHVTRGRWTSVVFVIGVILYIALSVFLIHHGYEENNWLLVVGWAMIAVPLVCIVRFIGLF